MRLLILTLLYACLSLNTAQGQDHDHSRTQFHFNLNYVNPFPESNNFERIGSVLGIRGGLTFEIEDDKYIGFDLSTSLFFPKGGGEVNSPKLLPQAKFKFAQSEQLWTEISLGALYNPSSLGFEVDLSYKWDKISSQKNIWSFYANGVSQTFDIPEEERRANAPVSWLGIAGLKYIRKFNDNFAMIIKPGIGLRGDSDVDTKIIANGSLTFSWKYLSVTAAYTNKVAQREFPAYFVTAVGLDVMKMIQSFRSKDDKKCHECILSK